MKIISIIGARPQFIKAAPFSTAIRSQAQEIILHTGQHYDENMSRIFFEEMGIPQPDYNLGVGSGPHGKQTGEMLIRIEEVLIKEKPDYLVIFGDTNSTLAGALAAAKLHIPVGHIEAGLRSFNRKMPEEINRILSDAISTQSFCPSENAVKLLADEGIHEGVHNCGDIMYDALLHFLPISEQRSSILKDLGLEKQGYYLFTLHRAENTDYPRRLRGIFRGLEAADAPIIYPVHPRMRERLKSPEMQEILKNVPQLRLCDPLGYLDILQLQSHARKILTDSGGMQKEAFFLKRPCITLRDESEWQETLDAGCNILVSADSQRIAEALRDFDSDFEVENFYGDGNAALKIRDKIMEFLQTGKR